MPVRKSDYPPDWPAIALQVKTDAVWCCEWCNAKHMTVIERKKTKANDGQNDWVAIEVVYNEAFQAYESTELLKWDRLRFYGLTRIVLTTAHLDRNTANSSIDNLAALCQRCHLRYDIRQHMANRKYGRYHNKEHQLKLNL